MKIKIFLLVFFIYLNCFCYDTDVHTYITFQSFDLLTYYFPQLNSSELAYQLGSASSTGTRNWETGLVMTGEIREDLQDVIYGYGPESDHWFPTTLSGIWTSAPTATVTHFWKADYGEDYQTPNLYWPKWWITYPNAYTKARKYLYGGWKLNYLAPGSQYVKEYKYNSLIELAKTGIIYQTGYYTVPTCDYTSLNPAQTVQLNAVDRKRFVYEILGRLLHLL